MILHPYRRTITRKGKTVKAWYFWYTDDTGKKVRKSCGTNGKPCLTKREALEYIETLNRNNLKKDMNMTLREYAENIYEPDSDFLLWQKYKGHEIMENTRKCKIRQLKRVLERFGDTKIKDLKTIDFDKWLLKSSYSVYNKNLIISVINEIYKSLYRDEILSNIFRLDAYGYPRISKKGILTLDEIKQLFPDDYHQLVQIWQTGKMTEFESYQFAVMVYLILTTGMRVGEVSALKWDQFIQQDVILINSMIDTNKERVDHLKKGNDINKKWRITILPGRTVNMLNTLHLMKIENTTDYVFEYENNYVNSQYVLRHLHNALEKNNIDWKTRNLTTHSLRFTYNTLMKNLIDNKQLRLLMGHEREDMTNYYDRSTALDNVPLLLQNKGTIDSVFN